MNVIEAFILVLSLIHGFRFVGDRAIMQQPLRPSEPVAYSKLQHNLTSRPLDLDWVELRRHGRPSWTAVAGIIRRGHLPLS